MKTPIEAKGKNGTVRFDGHTITIVRTGALEGDTLCEGTRTIDADRVTTVRFKPSRRVFGGVILFVVDGSREERRMTDSEIIAAAHHRDAVLFSPKHLLEFALLRAAVQTAIEARGDGRQRPLAA